MSQSVKIYPVKDVFYLLQDGIDYIGQRLKKGEVWESTTLIVAEAFLRFKQNPVVLDIGANLGAFSIPIGKMIKPVGGRLYAFEPQRLVYYQLCANLFLNGLSNCYANNYAVGAESGVIDVPILDVFKDQTLGALPLDPAIRELQGYHGENIHANSFESVKLVAIDELQLPAAHLIKVDVEGFELQVFKGAKEWIKQSYPPILFEIWSMESFAKLRNELVEYVENDLGYEIFIAGEMCIAQHPNNKLYDLKHSSQTGGAFDMVRRIQVQVSPPVKE